MDTREKTLFDQVRCLKVHDSYNRCWVPPVIGHWDQRGYTRCLNCPPGPAGGPQSLDPIHADNSAAIGCRCDFCGTSVLADALARFGGRQ